MTKQEWAVLETRLGALLAAVEAHRISEAQVRQELYELADMAVDGEARLELEAIYQVAWPA
jgi:hypothetical protein